MQGHDQELLLCCRCQNTTSSYDILPPNKSNALPIDTSTRPWPDLLMSSRSSCSDARPSHQHHTLGDLHSLVCRQFDNQGLHACQAKLTWLESPCSVALNDHTPRGTQSGMTGDTAVRDSWLSYEGEGDWCLVVPVKPSKTTAWFKITGTSQCVLISQRHINPLQHKRKMYK